MNFIKTDIEGVVVIEPKVHPDPRGYFFESYRKDVFTANGIPDDFVQDNYSSSQKGVLRGLHFQIEPKTQAKLIRVTCGAVYDVAVDLRKGSKTYGRYVGIELSAANKKMLYIPKGFAHGFLVLENATEFFYKCSNFYSPEHERGVIWNDPMIAVAWPRLDGDYILSEKDRKYPTLKDFRS